MFSTSARQGGTDTTAVNESSREVGRSRGRPHRKAPGEPDAPERPQGWSEAGREAATVGAPQKSIRFAGGHLSGPEGLLDAG